ncbi:Protein disulfide-isomerase like 2-1 [Zancudomyces culisetae]|uniref:Protein disulfide-isomerase like 2-1 n=1 Tax=Zancudomyces culisetae TaxID=1213189 RepID=A0A1R1PSW3_ZANCU|nr:Protein disulfide-isomerase like 2-1 [Zancudomyces culisetae]OMH84085.1 Protein disulfide-isomerase like 2-1 [Zancudomyces culisetae]|eukprot:OMH84084.1 Protein disulfide-isomerase like 2-1 [Zancudomyces culisetae]
MKFSATILGFVTLKSISVFASQGESSNVLSLNNDNFDKVVGSANKGAMVKFFAPWCPHCKDMAADYSKLASSFKEPNQKGVVIAEVDCTQQESLCTKYKIQGYPTVMWFKNGNTASPLEYNDLNEFEQLKTYVSQNI